MRGEEQGRESSRGGKWKGGRRRPAERSNGVGKEMGMIGSTESASIMQLMSNIQYSKGWTHLLQKRRRARLKLKEHRVRYYAIDKVVVERKNRTW